MADGVKRHAKATARVAVRGAEKLAKSADGLVGAAMGEVPSPGGGGGGGKARSGGAAPQRRRRDGQYRDTEPEYSDREIEDEWELGR